MNYLSGILLFYFTCLFGRIRGLPPKPLGVTGSRIRSQDSPEFVNLTLTPKESVCHEPRHQHHSDPYLWDFWQGWAWSYVDLNGPS